MTDLPAATQKDSTCVKAVRPDPGKIIVPRKHGQILTEPPLNQLRNVAATWHHENRDCPLPGFELTHRQMIALARHDLWQAAENHAQSIGVSAGSNPQPDQPWILTGHQVEFYHPGVWAKVVAADELAKRAGGVAFDLLVDHDVIDHLGFDVPVRDINAWTRKNIHYAQASAVPADGLMQPSPETFASWDAELGHYPLTNTDALRQFMTYLKPDTHHSQRHTPWLSRARRQFEQSLEIDVIHVPTSGLCSGEAWRHFVSAWINQAQTWILHYNHHLARYRQKAGIKNPHHPMPDLEHHDETYELPFWVYQIGQPRQRMMIRQARIILGDQSYSLAELAEAGYVIRPRALTLTMFVRMFIADAFIHGIGGALYDQITDALMQDLFSAAPPYCCVSAAWLLPLGQPLESHGTVSHLRWSYHHATHNPDRYLDQARMKHPDIKELIRQREHMVESIATSLQQNRKAERSERQAMFRKIHEINAKLHAASPDILAGINNEMEATLKAQQENKVLLWREYFFALHNKQSLQQMIHRIRQS